MNDENILKSAKQLCGSKLGAAEDKLRLSKDLGVTEGTVCLAASRTQFIEYLPEIIGGMSPLEVVARPLSAFGQISRNATNQAAKPDNADMADLYFARH